MNLPIDVVPQSPGVYGTQFRWQSAVDLIARGQLVDCEGAISPPSAEFAVMELIAIVKRQAAEIEALKRQLQVFADRITTQSEMLSKRAEGTNATQPTGARRKGTV